MKGQPAGDVDDGEKKKRIGHHVLVVEQKRRKSLKKGRTSLLPLRVKERSDVRAGRKRIKEGEKKKKEGGGVEKRHRTSPFKLSDDD